MEAEKNPSQDPREGGKRKLKGREIALGIFTVAMGLIASFLIISVYRTRIGDFAGWIVGAVLIFVAINLIIFMRPVKKEDEKDKNRD